MRVSALHHVSFDVTDLGRTEAFAQDFGLITVERRDDRLVMRTGGGDAYSYVARPATQRAFTGIAFEVAGEAELAEAVERHGATPVRDLDLPGGGKAVTLRDPDGLAIDLVTGVKGEPRHAPHPPLMLNTPGNPGRLTDATQPTRKAEPARLHRLGHMAIFCRSFAASFPWYRDVLGLVPSDMMYDRDPDKVVVAFMRINGGETPVDHHTFLLFERGRLDLHHISFEVQDFEEQFMAHRWLGSRGWTPNWGVGRHPLGSHVFDVWLDPDGYRFETFSDTDLVTMKRPTGSYELHETELDIWSSETPERYFA